MTRALIFATVASSLSLGCIGVSQSQAAGGEPAAAGPPAPAILHPSLKTCKGETRATPESLIDDFEDGDTKLAGIEGRDGPWWRAHDPDGSTIGPEDSAPISVDGSEVFHVVGQTSSKEGAWGVNFGTNFNAEGKTYDASKYAGVTFRAKAGENSTKKLRFKISDVNTHKDTGVCKDCWNHFGKDLTLTTEFKQYTILFSELAQGAGWGDPRPGSVTPSELYGLDWSIGPDAAFEIWVDDVSFVACR